MLGPHWLVEKEGALWSGWGARCKGLNPWAPSQPHLTSPVTQTGASLCSTWCPNPVIQPLRFCLSRRALKVGLSGQLSRQHGPGSWYVSWARAGSQPLGAARARWLGGPSPALDSGLGVFLVSPNQAEVRLLYWGSAQTLYKDRPGDPARRLPCSGVGSPGPTRLGEGHLSKIAEPGQRGPQDPRLQVQRSRALRPRALSSAFAKRPWNLCSGPGGREASPSPQGRRLAPRSLRPHLEHAQVASGCVGWGSAGGWGDGGETAGEELGEAGVPAAPPGWAAPACPPRGRSRCRPARRMKPPAPTPPGRFAPVLPGHGLPRSLPPEQLCLCPRTVWPLSAPALPQPALQLVPKSIA